MARRTRRRRNSKKSVRRKSSHLRSYRKVNHNRKRRNTRNKYQSGGVELATLAIVGLVTTFGLSATILWVMKMYKKTRAEARQFVNKAMESYMGAGATANPMAGSDSGLSPQYALPDETDPESGLKVAFVDTRDDEQP